MEVLFVKIQYTKMDTSHPNGVAVMHFGWYDRPKCMPYNMIGSASKNSYETSDSSVSLVLYMTI